MLCYLDGSDPWLCLWKLEAGQEQCHWINLGEILCLLHHSDLPHSQCPCPALGADLSSLYLTRWRHNPGMASLSWECHGIQLLSLHRSSNSPTLGIQTLLELWEPRESPFTEEPLGEEPFLRSSSPGSAPALPSGLQAEKHQRTKPLCHPQLRAPSPVAAEHLEVPGPGRAQGTTEPHLELAGSPWEPSQHRKSFFFFFKFISTE